MAKSASVMVSSSVSFEGSNFSAGIFSEMVTKRINILDGDFLRGHFPFVLTSVPRKLKT